jgi:hypothetical protein
MKTTCRLSFYDLLLDIFCFSGIPTMLGGSTAENTETVNSIEQFNGSNWTVEGKVNKLGAWGSSVALPLTENEQC